MILTILLAVFTAAMTFAQPRLRPETQEQRVQRLQVLQRNRALVGKMQNRAKDNTATVQPNAISLNCVNPVYVANWGSMNLQWLCDITGSGTANILGNFFQMPAGNPIGLSASPDGFLLATDGQGTIYRLTDTLNRGVADENYVVYSGISSSQRLFAASGSDLMIEDDFHGQLFHYSLSGGQATTYPTGSLPVLGSGNTGFVISTARHELFAINEQMDAVAMYGFSGGQLQGQPQYIFSGNQINTLALDETSGILFIQTAGNCNNQQPALPSDGNSTDSGSGPVTAPACLLPQIWALRTFVSPFQSGPTLNLIASGDVLNLYYSTNSFPMAVVGGKLLVTSLTADSQSELILSYDYKTAMAMQNPAAPTVFADQQLLGQYAFIGALTSYNGGPVPNLQ